MSSVVEEVKLWSYGRTIRELICKVLEEADETWADVRSIDLSVSDNFVEKVAGTLEEDARLRALLGMADYQWDPVKVPEEALEQVLDLKTERSGDSMWTQRQDILFTVTTDRHVHATFSGSEWSHILTVPRNPA